MSDFMLDQYEEYLDDFKAWGREFHKKPLTYNQFERLKIEQEDLDIQEECGSLSKREHDRRDTIERLLLTHASYFVEGSRVVITHGKRD